MGDADAMRQKIIEELLEASEASLGASEIQPGTNLRQRFTGLTQKWVHSNRRSERPKWRYGPCGGIARRRDRGGWNV